jgi:hypothetical protein
MRKHLAVFLMIATLFLISSVASAQAVTTVNHLASVTLGWDVVPFPTGVTTGTIKYQAYTKNPATGVAVKAGAEVTANQIVIASFIPWQEYVFGVESLYYKVGNTTTTPDAKSPSIAWSDVAADCSAAGTFSNMLQPALDKVKNLLLK